MLLRNTFDMQWFAKQLFEINIYHDADILVSYHVSIDKDNDVESANGSQTISPSSLGLATLYLTIAWQFHDKCTQDDTILQY